LESSRKENKHFNKHYFTKVGKMSVVKIISIILLGIYLFFSSAFKLLAFTPQGMVAFCLGLSAIGAGTLILIAVREYLHFGESGRKSS
jgi:hypothetical protein